LLSFARLPLCWSQSRARLLYRGTRDGFGAAKMLQRIAGKANTLILVKVSWIAGLSCRRHQLGLGGELVKLSAVVLIFCRALCFAMRCLLPQVSGNGYLRGGYTPVAWPAERSRSYKADRTRRTCLFSLVNAHGRPAPSRGQQRLIQRREFEPAQLRIPFSGTPLSLGSRRQTNYKTNLNFDEDLR